MQKPDRASVSGNRKKVLGLRKCVYGISPVSAHPWGATWCLLLEHVGARTRIQTHLVGTWSTISWMITGDYHHTAIVVASDVGLLSRHTQTVIVDIARQGRPQLSDQGQYAQEGHDSQGQNELGVPPSGLRARHSGQGRGQGLKLEGPEQRPEHQLEAQLIMAQNYLESSRSRTILQKEEDQSNPAENQQPGCLDDQRNVLFAGATGRASLAGLSQHSPDAASTSAAAAGLSQWPTADNATTLVRLLKKSVNRVQLAPLATPPTSLGLNSPSRFAGAHPRYPQSISSDHMFSPLPVIMSLVLASLPPRYPLLRCYLHRCVNPSILSVPPLLMIHSLHTLRPLPTTAELL